MNGIFRSAGKRGVAAFSLMELLVVVAILGILAAVIAPAISGGGSATFTKAASDIAGILGMARTHAMAHNTYVWVGFYEEDEGTITPTKTAPPYSGKGKVVVGVVASVDGTPIFSDGASTADLPADRIVPVERIFKFRNVHLADLPAPSGGESSSLGGRPSSPSSDAASRISSESSASATHPFTAQNYKFFKTVRLSPRGEATVNDGDIKRVIEIGLRPTRGATVDQNAANVAAVQMTGIGGNVQIYRP